MKVYKVLSKQGGNLVSAVTYSSDFKTEYNRAGWTHPKVKGTRLFVFDTLSNARSWASYDNEIWECETKRTYKCIRSWYIADYWKYKLSHKRVSHISQECTIPGSLMVDKVKLLKRVK